MTRDHERLTTTTLLTLCVAAFFCFAALAAPVFVGLPTRVSEMADTGDLRWVLAIGAVAAVVTAPVLGWLSDRTLPRLGHRVPWLVAEIVAGAGLLSVAAVVESLAGLTVTWAAATACHVAALTTLLATLTDVAPARDRCRVAGWFTATTAAALLLGAGLFAWSPDHTFVTFTTMGLVAVAAVVAAGWQLLRVPVLERPPPGTAAERAGAPFWWLWGQRLVAQAGFSFIGVLAVGFVARRTGQADGDAEAIAIIGYAVATIIGLLLAALVARRLARRAGFSPVLSLGLALVMLGNAVAAIATSSPAYLLAVIVAGAGFWMYAALDLAAALALLPVGSRGRYLGLFAGAQLLAPAAAVVASPWLWKIGGGDLVGADQARNYFVVFAVAGGLALAAVLLLGRLTLPDGEGVPRRSRPRQTAATP